MYCMYTPVPVPHGFPCKGNRRGRRAAMLNETPALPIRLVFELLATVIQRDSRKTALARRYIQPGRFVSILSDHRKRRRAMTASANVSIIATESAQPIHASVMLCP